MFNELTGLKLEISLLSGLRLSNGTTVVTFAFLLSLGRMVSIPTAFLCQFHLEAFSHCQVW